MDSFVECSVQLARIYNAAAHKASIVSSTQQQQQQKTGENLFYANLM